MLEYSASTRSVAAHSRANNMEGQGVRVIPEVTSSSGETGEEEEDRENKSPHLHLRCQTQSSRLCAQSMQVAHFK